MIRPKSLRNWRRLNLGFDAETTWPNSRLYGQLACWRNRRVPVKRGFYEKVAARRDQRASVLGKILSAMENSCEQCDAILLEYRIAYLDFWERASQETRDACKAVGELIGGSEADLQRVEDRLPRFRPMTAEQLNIAAMKAGVRYLRREDPLRHVMLKRWLHQQATGHVVHLSDKF